MDKKVAPNRKTGRMIAKNLIILLVLVAVTFVSIWSWFTDKTSASADGITVNCKKPDGVEFAVVDKGATPTDSDFTRDPGEFFTLSSGSDFLSGLTMSEVTSDGVNFYKPLLNQTGGIARPDTRPQAKWSTATANESYLSFDIYFRSKTSYTIYLNKGSYFLAKSEEDGKSLTGANAGNISTFGNFSKDSIVGASRLSIVDADDSTLKFLWIPRPDILFSSDAGNSVSTGVTSGDTYNHYYYTNADSVTAKKVKTEYTGDNLIVSELDADTDRYAFPEKTEMTNLTVKNKDGYFYNHVTCNIWMDGEDSESRLALVNGQFVVNLDITIL